MDQLQSHIKNYFLEQTTKIGVVLASPKLDVLQQLFRLTSYPKGSHITLPGQQLDTVLFVNEGLLRIYSIDEDGKEHNKGFVLPHTLIGKIIAGDPNWPAPYGIQALSDSEVLTTNTESISNCITQSQPLQMVFAALQTELFAYKAKRAAAFQMLSATERYNYFIKNESLLSRLLPAYHIASYLGMSEVTLSRLRKHSQ